MAVTVNDIHFLDPCGRCDAIGEVLPEFPRLVVERFNHFWEGNPTYKQREGRRWNAFADSENSLYLKPPHLGWEQEVFELSFQDVLYKLCEGCHQHDPLTTAAIRGAAAALSVPDVRLDVAFELSRGPRPEIPHPQTQVDTVTSPSVIEADSEFAGWYRIGYWEEEIQQRTPEVSRFEAYFGLALGRGVNDFSSVAIPFADGDNVPFWTNPAAISQPWSVGAIGPLVSARYHRGLCLRGFRLAPHVNLVGKLELQLGEWPSRLQFVDQSKRPAIVLRIWTADPIAIESVGQKFRFDGCELLMRADLFESFKSSTYGSMFIVTRTERQSVS